MAILQLETLKVSETVKAQLAGILEQAAAPDELGQAIARLPPSRQSNIQQTASAVRSSFNTVSDRGRAGLLAISPQEWERMLPDE